MSTCRHDVAGSSKILVWTSTRTSRSPARLWLRAMSGGGRIDPASKITEREDRGPRTQWGHAYSGGETVSLPSTEVRRFNGATPIQAWKPSIGFSLYLLYWSFNGATPIQAWKHPKAEIEHPANSFNGATPIQAWKREITRKGGLCGVSMGPRLFRRGNSLIAFNGATPIQAWKQPYRLESPRDMYAS